MSALELLLDKNYPHRDSFGKCLAEALVFEEFSNGEDNYKYLRELRNCIVHRGYDITCAAHTPGGHPLLLAPQTIPNRSGNAEYIAFGKYILEIVLRMEAVVGATIYKHVEAVGLFEATYTTDEQLEKILSFVENTDIMPDHVKRMAMESIPRVNFNEIKEHNLKQFKEIITTSVLTEELV